MKWGEWVKGPSTSTNACIFSTLVMHHRPCIHPRKHAHADSHTRKHAAHTCTQHTAHTAHIVHGMPTCSPRRPWGRPTTATAATAGWRCSTASTSLLYTFSPPLLIVSFRRPSSHSWPRASRQPRSPVRSQASGPSTYRTGQHSTAQHSVISHGLGMTNNKTGNTE